MGTPFLSHFSPLSPRPRFSVVICTYNYAHFLPQALASVAAQSFTDYEVLVVDDGSTDGTDEVVAAWQQRLRGLRYCVMTHAGLPAARNHGLAEARGECIAFLDADDLWSPDYLATADTICRTEAAELVMFNGYRVYGDGRVIRRFKRKQPPRSDIMHFLASTPSSMVVSRHLAERTGGYDERFPVTNDLHWQVRALRTRPVVRWVQQPMLVYRHHGDNLSGSWERIVAEWLRLHADLFQQAEAPEAASARRFTRELLPRLLSLAQARAVRQILRQARRQFPGDVVFSATYASTYAGSTPAMRLVRAVWRFTEPLRVRNRISYEWPPERIFAALESFQR